MTVFADEMNRHCYLAGLAASEDQLSHINSASHEGTSLFRSCMSYCLHPGIEQG
jgi:hypothetical protein